VIEGLKRGKLPVSFSNANEMTFPKKAQCSDFMSQEENTYLTRYFFYGL